MGKLTTFAGIEKDLITNTFYTMKRITFILAVAAALCAFSSCKKTDAQEVTIFGTWTIEKQVTEYIIDLEDHKAGDTEEKTMAELGYTCSIVFNEDYTYKMTYSTKDGANEVSGKFTYDETTKVITINSHEETVESLTATELHLKHKLTAEGKLYAYQTDVCKKVK